MCIRDRFGTGRSPRQTMFYYRGSELFAVRKGPYKAHFITQLAYGRDKPVKHDPPVLYHLEHDPSEKYDVAQDHPDVIADIMKEVEQHRAALKPGEDQLVKRIQQVYREIHLTYKAEARMLEAFIGRVRNRAR